MSIEHEALEAYKSKISDKNDCAFIPYHPSHKLDLLYLAGGVLGVGGIFPYLGKKIYNKKHEELIQLKDIIQIPDQIFTGNLVTTGHIDIFENQHLKEYDFHFFKHSVNISEIHNDKIKINQVNISCTLNGDKPENMRPCVTDFYPRTSFVDANYKGSFKLFFTGGLGISSEYDFEENGAKLNAEARAKLESEADFVYNYNPKIAAISGFMNGSIINYTFRKADNSYSPYPTGALEIFGVFMRPRSVHDITLQTSVTINNWPIPIVGITRLLLSESDPNKLIESENNKWSLLDYIKDKFPTIYHNQKSIKHIENN